MASVLSVGTSGGGVVLPLPSFLLFPSSSLLSLISYKNETDNNYDI